MKAGRHAGAVEKVVVHLHPSFKVSTYELTAPDAAGTFWTIPITGWGTFQIGVEVHFTHGRGKASLSHMLELGTPMVSRHVAIPAHFLVSPVAAAAAAAVFGGGASAAGAVPPPWIAMQQQQMHAPLFGAAPAGMSGMQQQRRWMAAHPRSRRAVPQPAAPAPIVIAGGKPEDKKHTILALVLDRSGSMSVMGNEVEGGANAYLDEQRKSDVDDGARTSVVMCTFDNTVDTVHENADLTAVPPITHEQVEPRGMTALYDGIGEALVKTAAIVNGLATKPSVTIFILTDGQENSSQKWSKAAIAAEITKLQKPESGSWDFYFAAANQDAMSEGSSLGMDSEQCITFSGKSGAKMKQTMAMTNMAYQRKKKSNGMRKGWSAAERSSCM